MKTTGKINSSLNDERRITMSKKKIIIILGIIGVILVIVGGVFWYEYKTEALGKPFICSSVDNNGKFSGVATTFSANSTQVNLVSKSNKSYIKEAEITWYNYKDSNKALKTEVVQVKDGYFISTLSREEGLKSGSYIAYIMINNKKQVSLEKAEFTVN